jgi:hypothetical protein
LRTIYIKEKGNLSTRKIKKIGKKLEKLKKKEPIVVALANSINDNIELIEEIESHRIKILNGRWLFKFFICNILNYIAEYKKKELESLNISFLINHAEDVVIYQIAEISKQIKGIKIVTPNISNFSKIEEELYLEYGIPIQITNNKEKALASSEVIVNIDFKEEKINEYKINNQAIIINIGNEAKVKSPSFIGEIFDYYEIKCEEDYLEELKKGKDLGTNVLYESLIYKRDTFEHIKKQLNIDGVSFSRLIKKKLDKAQILD